MKHLHHVHRIDTLKNHTHQWVVRVQRRGKVVLRHFTDGRCGGKTKALQVAIAFRDETLKQMPDTGPVQWWRTKRRRNNTSGIVGVGRYVSMESNRSGDHFFERICWQAFWDGLDGKRHSRKFSVKTNGERRAKQLACKARRDAMRVIMRASRRAPPKSSR